MKEFDKGKMKEEILKAVLEKDFNMYAFAKKYLSNPKR
jgi:hypothetical protein